MILDGDSPFGVPNIETDHGEEDSKPEHTDFDSEPKV